MLSLIAAALVVPAAQSTPLTIAEALAKADVGKPVMMEVAFPVASANRTANQIYLNSDADFRAPTNVSVMIRPVAAKALTKRLGAPPETALLGKTVIVRGVLTVGGAYSNLAGRPHTLRRITYTLPVDRAEQIVAVR